MTKKSAHPAEVGPHGHIIDGDLDTYHKLHEDTYPDGAPWSFMATVGQYYFFSRFLFPHMNSEKLTK